MASFERIAEAGAGTGFVIVWDPLVRLFHWSLVVTFFIPYLFKDPARIHEPVGYVALGLVAFRLVWGLVGPRYARFGDFVRPPSVVLGYLNDLRRRQARRYLGHNPAGGAMIVALLLGVALTGVSGWLSTTDRFHHSAPMERLHDLLADLTFVLILIHVTGAVVTSLLHRENLVLAMITGRKRAEPDD